MTEKETSRDIVLGDRKITVLVLRVRDSAKVERMRVAAKETPSDDLDVQVLREYVYPLLFGCSVGDLPSEEDFLNMPAVEAGIWYEAVDALNPGLLLEGDFSDEKKSS